MGYACRITKALIIQSGPKKIYTLFTHQYLWNKFKWNFYLWGSLKDDVYRRKPATLDDPRESIAMSCAAITLDTLQNVVHAAVRRLRQCLDADGGHFEHLHWIQNSRTSLIAIFLLYKYSSYDYRVIFFMSKCAYIFLGHSVFNIFCFSTARTVTHTRLLVTSHYIPVLSRLSSVPPGKYRDSTRH